MSLWTVFGVHVALAAPPLPLDPNDVFHSGAVDAKPLIVERHASTPLGLMPAPPIELPVKTRLEALVEAWNSRHAFQHFVAQRRADATLVRCTEYRQFAHDEWVPCKGVVDRRIDLPESYQTPSERAELMGRFYSEAHGEPSVSWGGSCLEGLPARDWPSVSGDVAALTVTLMAGTPCVTAAVIVGFGAPGDSTYGNSVSLLGPERKITPRAAVFTGQPDW